MSKIVVIRNSENGRSIGVRNRPQSQGHRDINATNVEVISLP